MSGASPVSAHLLLACSVWLWVGGWQVIDTVSRLFNPQVSETMNGTGLGLGFLFLYEVREGDESGSHRHRQR